MPWRTIADDLEIYHRRFHRTIHPQCEEFTRDLSDMSDERRAQHFKLTELLMKLLLNIDGLVLDNEELKQKKRTLIYYVQEQMRRLDECL